MNTGNISENKDLAAKLLKETKEKKREYNVGYKELKSLRKNKYAEKSDDFDTSYVIQNTKTKQIVEIKAASVILAAKMVGWRPRHVKLIQVNENQKD